jgi:ATP-binding cassette subfamily B protein
MPVFAGRLIDAAAPRAAVIALASMAGLGAGVLVLRQLAFFGIIRLTLATMTEIAQEAFWRVQRFSTDWHANTFAGSTVRKISRGMWALDILNDTVLIALLPSLVVLLGTTVLLGLRWLALGLVVAAGAAAYLALTMVLAFAYVAPASRLSNLWDTRIGGALADAVSCNAVVKAFGAETREDVRLASLLAKWRRRMGLTWRRDTNGGTAQLATLQLLRVVIIGLALFLWSEGRATAGDVTYVLTTYFVLSGYLRDVGMHIRNLRRSVNELEEVVAIEDEPLGVADREDAVPIRIDAGRVVFERVRFHYAGHTAPLFEDFSLAIAAGERVGLVGPSGSGKTSFVKLVQRLYDVAGGRVLIDGQDVALATQSSLRRQIAIVPQEPVLFHRSLAENIAYGRPGATPAEIERAAALANAAGFIERLPKGYATLVGERGVKLSGGERQRVA